MEYKRIRGWTPGGGGNKERFSKLNEIAMETNSNEPLRCHIQSSLQMKPETEAKILITQNDCNWIFIETW